jgi:endonuclease YncB( thermonuclease family)
MTAPERTASLALLLVGILLVGVEPTAVGSQRLTGRVLRVSDGDTFTMVNGTWVLDVRLFGVDCPEMDQPYGPEAKRFTAERIADRTVDVTPVTTDQYGRIVGRVRVNGEDLSLALLQRGLAWHLVEYSADETFASAERHARAWRVGLWSQPNPVPPRVRRSGNTRAGPARPRVPAPAADETGPYRGNTRTKVFHRPGCRNYSCKDCTQVFTTTEEALHEGYKPAGCCHSRKQRPPRP